MSNKTLRVLFYIIFLLVVINGFQDAWDIVHGPLHYDPDLSDGFASQLVLVFNAMMSGIGNTAILVALYYFATRGGLQAPVLRSLGRYVATWLIVLTPIVALAFNFFWLGGVLPNHIAFIKPLFVILELILLFLMVKHSGEGAFAPKEARTGKS